MILDFRDRETTDENDMAKLKNIHPGEILLEDFLAPLCGNLQSGLKK